MSDGEALIRWYLAVTALTVALLPFTAWLGVSLGNARFALARPLGLAGATALVWWPAIAFGLPFARWSVVVLAVAAGLGGWVFWWRRDFDGLNLPALALFEGLWLLVFAGYSLFRSYNPDIANTEKPMEIALLSSISRSSDVPAPDPWLAGSAINYYYFGYQSIATLVKLGGVPPVIAFNLALASIFASCATVAAGIGLALARIAGVNRMRRLASAAVAPVLLLLAGNLETARRLARHFDQTIHAGWWDGAGWQASRIIVDHGVHGNPDARPTINEFPAFSFVLGDLHPHVLTYPLLACVLALALGIALRDEGRALSRLIAIGGLVGLLYASNSWDAPAGLLFVVGAIALVYRTSWRMAIRPIALVCFGAAVVALPFLLTFHAPVGADDSSVPSWLSGIPVLGTVLKTFGIVDWRPSSVRELIIVHGVWLVAFLGWFLVVAGRDRRTRLALARNRDMLLVAASLTLAGALIWMPALVLVGWPLALAAWVAVSGRRADDRLVGGLYAVGFLLILVPEFIYIQDVFADRMNTVFKLYFQAWLVLAIAAAATLARVTTARAVTWRVFAAVGALLLLAVALPYTPISAWDWTSGFSERRGLDGSAYVATYSPADASVIGWIREHAGESDTLVEAPGCSYGSFGGVPMSRVSAFSGVPGLIGWQGHEYQWRRGNEAKIRLLDVRVEEANSLLSGILADAAGVQPRFLILGRQEQEENPSCSLTVARDESVVAQLEGIGWVVAFESRGTRVFVRSGDPLAAEEDPSRLSAGPLSR